MKPLSIRTSLTLWFVGLTGLLLVAFSATLYLGMRDTLVTEFDARLQTRAEAMVAVCEWETDTRAVEFEMSAEMAAEFTGQTPGRGVDVCTWPAGEVVHASGVPLGAPSSEPPIGVTLGFLDAEQQARVCTVRRPLPAGASDSGVPEVVVRVAESFLPVREQLARVRGIILLMGAIAACVVGAFGFLLSRRFVRPLRELGEAAAAVDASSASAPMPRRGNGDEVDRLAQILDRTFASLRDALERKTRFTADAAHELRNPVSVIRNAADVALRNGRSEVEVRQFLHDILETSKRMGGVVQSLLTLARLDAKSVALDVDDVDLADVVREAVAACRDDSSRISVQPGVVGAVRGDKALLRVLVDNLIGNALRHSQGAKVDVSVASVAGGRASLQVRDHGPGVPPGDQQHVFQRFFRAGTPATCEGAGLGLSIVAEVAAAHGASCRIEDAKPGARVSVVFPGVDAVPHDHR